MDEHNNLFDLFERTLNNCRFYDHENMLLRLYNELGCLRGIFYCIENLNMVDYLDCDSFNAFHDFISKYSDLIYKDFRDE